MNRLLRIFSTALTVLLAGLSVATLIAWPCSYASWLLQVRHHQLAVDPSGPPGSASGYTSTVRRVQIVRGVLVAEHQKSVPQDSYFPAASSEWDFGTPKPVNWGFGSSFNSTTRTCLSMPEERPFGWPTLWRGTDAPFKASLHRFTIPCWWLAILFAALPGLRLHRSIRKVHRARRRQRAGLCVACGYDLRATPQRCPECGAQVDLAAN